MNLNRDTSCLKAPGRGTNHGPCFLMPMIWWRLPVPERTLVRPDDDVAVRQPADTRCLHVSMIHHESVGVLDNDICL
jgi:hypothetical protein